MQQAAQHRHHTQAMRWFLVLLSASFGLAGLTHAGLIVPGYAHPAASLAESAISTVLLIGLCLSLVWPARTRAFALAAETFAMFGTLVGVLTIAIGIGPRTAPDLAFHIAVLVGLGWGLMYAAGRLGRV